MYHSTQTICEKGEGRDDGDSRDEEGGEWGYFAVEIKEARVNGRGNRTRRINEIPVGRRSFSDGGTNAEGQAVRGAC